MADDYGIKISKDGYDIATATDEQLVLTSRLNSLKNDVTLQGSTTQSVAANSILDISIAHNLGYTPAFEAWYKNTAGVWSSPFQNVILFSSDDIFAYSQGGQHYADSSNLHIFIHNSNPTTAQNVTLYYIIFLDKSA